MPIIEIVPQDRFHGRFESQGQCCQWQGCDQPSEFRAPGPRRASFDGPGEWRWLCLDHVRQFNAGYDWFEGMDGEEIWEAQRVTSGWRTEAVGFAPGGPHNGLGNGMPRWADYTDPLDAISARAAGIKDRAEGKARAMGQGQSAFARFNEAELEALQMLGLGQSADKAQLRRRYGELVRRYHPDRNGGDRQYEQRLGKVVEAYQLLRKAPAFR